MASTKKVTLKSSDGVTFEVDEAVALQMQTIKHMIEDDCADNVIPLPNVTSEILSKVIKYCKKHAGEVKKEAGEVKKETQDTYVGFYNQGTRRRRRRRRIISSSDEDEDDDEEEQPEIWDMNFVKCDQATLFDLILAANYLNIKSLLDLTCQKVADMIKGKTPKEIQKMFDIKIEFTPEEEEEVRRENQWAFV